MTEVWETEPVIRHSMRLLHCYGQLLGRDLLTDLPPDASELARSRALFEAPFAVLSHGTEPSPIYNYGNRFALDLWEMSWDAWLKMPSRQSAEPDLREERDRVLKAVSDRGYIEHYTGVRISSTGRRFRIQDVTVWNLTDDAGNRSGQAAVYRHYQRL